MRNEVLNYQYASFETAKNQFSKITFLKTSPCTANMWQIVELRSANIPTTWDAIANMAALFELLATLEASGFKLNIIDLSM